MAGETDHWIGAYRVGKENEIDKFAWIDGSSLAYEKFTKKYSNPSNSNGNEFCVAKFYVLTEDEGQWNDYDCWSKSHWYYLIKNVVCQRSLSSKTQSIKGGTYKYYTCPVF